MEQSQDTGHQAINMILMIIAFTSGWKGMTATDIDILLSILLKLLSCISMILIIAINWKSGVNIFKDIFRKK